MDGWEEEEGITFIFTEKTFPFPFGVVLFLSISFFCTKMCLNFYFQVVLDPAQTRQVLDANFGKMCGLLRLVCLDLLKNRESFEVVFELFLKNKVIVIHRRK